MGKFILILVIVPILELAVLMKAGSLIGVGWTIALVVATAAIGAALAKYQGLSTIMSIKESLARGQMPGNQIVEGLLVLVGGIMLLFPGFITDLMGLLLLLPFTRVFFRERVKDWLRKKLESGSSANIRIYRM